MVNLTQKDVIEALNEKNKGNILNLWSSLPFSAINIHSYKFRGLDWYFVIARVVGFVYDCADRT